MGTKGTYRANGDYGEGNKVGFMREVGTITDIVLIETGDNGVAVIGNETVEALLGGAKPVVLLTHGCLVSTHGGA
jgi:hypothetical protein